MTPPSGIRGMQKGYCPAAAKGQISSMRLVILAAFLPAFLAAALTAAPALADCTDPPDPEVN